MSVAFLDQIKYLPVGSWLAGRVNAYWMRGQTKADLLNHLGRRHGYRDYLEFCTPTTGQLFAAIDRSAFETVRRAIYRCPPEHGDGMPIDFRTETSEVGPMFAEIRETEPRPDVCLIDSYHSYEDSLRDLREIVKLLPAGGIAIVHDCLPPQEGQISPTFKAGAWFGVSFKAFLDFVLTEDGFDYITIDCDYGCGLIAKNRRIVLPESGIADALAGGLTGRNQTGMTAKRERLRREWLAIGDDYDRAFAFLRRHRVDLLRLTTPRAFYDGFDLAEVS